MRDVHGLLDASTPAYLTVWNRGGGRWWPAGRAATGGPCQPARGVDRHLSYRRQDAAACAGRLRSDLARRYSDESVFLDVADLAPGIGFATHLHEAVASCGTPLDR
jgi:hypothetical protein